MAQYVCSVRTNYFSVKDESAFADFLAHVKGDTEKVQVFSRENADGSKTFGFGCAGGIFGYVPDGADADELERNDAYVDFLHGLQDHIGNGDAAIIFESGWEKLRYVVGNATVVTQRGTSFVCMQHEAIARAQKMLGNPDFATVCEY
ncbi:hypothetical protein [Agathobaculum desmolans]|uniref:hypothetical protein n=1 Tax=Agathobaculum desmolans TaxID=39484 RepID=UPI00248E8F15|nr:hypothetical protein [Agathobaculum desmolans]